MDHVALIRSLPASEKAALTHRSDRIGLTHLAGYLALLTATTLGLVMQVPFWPLLLLPQGILLVFLFTLSHECTHKTPFRSVWINEVVGHAIAPVLLLPFTWFRYFHLAHHKHTNDPAHDPELADGGRPRTRAAWLIHLSGWGFWRGNMAVILSNARGSITAPYLPTRRHKAMRLEARIILGVIAAALLSLLITPVLVWLWLVPVLIAQPVLRLYLLAEHGLCPPVANMLENSRTTYTGRLVRFVAWNMPYHAEHHSFPAVPFHQLPTFHAHAAAHLRSTSNGYAAFTSEYLHALES